ncbi:hypothetical protein Bbelb_108900 [Branchiostoma belcheri]|nr:hypothetical protein Bbelb_108900 [Branchiostoma belcheri]
MSHKTGEMLPHTLAVPEEHNKGKVKVASLTVKLWRTNNGDKGREQNVPIPFGPNVSKPWDRTKCPTKQENAPHTLAVPEEHNKGTYIYTRSKVSESTGGNFRTKNLTF